MQILIQTLNTPCIIFVISVIPSNHTITGWFKNVFTKIDWKKNNHPLAIFGILHDQTEIKWIYVSSDFTNLVIYKGFWLNAWNSFCRIIFIKLVYENLNLFILQSIINPIYSFIHSPTYLFIYLFITTIDYINMQHMGTPKM